MAKIVDKRNINTSPTDKKEFLIKSLFEETKENKPVVEANPDQVQYIPFSQIKGRDKNEFITQEDKAFKLAINIANYGLMEKIHIFIIEDEELNKNGIYYEISAGHTRYMACRLAKQMAMDGSLLEYLILTSRDIKKGITLEQKMQAIAENNTIGAFVHDADADIEEEIHRTTNLGTRVIKYFEYIETAPKVSTPEEHVEALRYLYGDERINEMIAKGNSLVLSQSEMADYISKWHFEKYSVELKKETLRKYLRAYNALIPEVLDAVFEGKVLISDSTDVIAKFDAETQRKLLECYKTDEYEKIINDLKKNNSNKDKDELNDDPYKKISKIIKNYEKLTHSSISEVEKELKKMKPTANTKEVIKKIKKLEKAIQELIEMPLQ